VTFRALSPEEFAAFHEPGYVKIAWTLGADPIGATESIFRTETRVTATDSRARMLFRHYRSLLSPGIIVIRWMSLAPLRKEAERRARERGREPARASRHAVCSFHVERRDQSMAHADVWWHRHWVRVTESVLAHTAAIVVGFAMMVVGLGLGVTIIMLPAG